MRERATGMVHALRRGIAVEHEEIAELSKILFQADDSVLVNSGRRHHTRQTLKGLEVLQKYIQRDLHDLGDVIEKLVTLTYSAPGMKKKLDEMEERLLDNTEVSAAAVSEEPDFFTGGSWKTSHAISVAGRAEHVLGGGITEAQVVVPAVHDNPLTEQKQSQSAVQSEKANEASEEPVLRPCGTRMLVTWLSNKLETFGFAVAVVDFEPLEGYASQMLRLSAGDQILLAGQVGRTVPAVQKGLIQKAFTMLCAGRRERLVVRYKTRQHGRWVTAACRYNCRLGHN
eukprot:GHVS01064176.1.p1 GENE.GHVS01064176.1~~GHVS01064176.1.p1  ORF type:complete len:285 (+),score=24.56 GHVS01064176.1:271-1125(+)